MICFHSVKKKNTWSLKRMANTATKKEHKEYYSDFVYFISFFSFFYLYNFETFEMEIYVIQERVYVQKVNIWLNRKLFSTLLIVMNLPTCMCVMRIGHRIVRR